MRTTIDLPEDVLAEAKQRAARQRRSLSEVVTDAVRSSFARIERGSGDHVELPTYGEGGLQPGVDLDDSAALLELMERDA